MDPVADSSIAIQPLLDVKSVASILDLPARSVYVLVESGQLAHYKLGRRLRFRSQDVERFIELGRVPAEALS